MTAEEQRELEKQLTSGAGDETSRIGWKVIALIIVSIIVCIGIILLIVFVPSEGYRILDSTGTVNNVIFDDKMNIIEESKYDFPPMLKGNVDWKTPGPLYKGEAPKNNEVYKNIDAPFLPETISRNEYLGKVLNSEVEHYIEFNPRLM